MSLSDGSAAALRWIPEYAIVQASAHLRALGLEGMSMYHQQAYSLAFLFMMRQPHGPEISSGEQSFIHLACALLVIASDGSYCALFHLVNDVVIYAASW